MALAAAQCLFQVPALPGALVTRFQPQAAQQGRALNLPCRPPPPTARILDGAATVYLCTGHFLRASLVAGASVDPRGSRGSLHTQFLLQPALISLVFTRMKMEASLFSLPRMLILKRNF